MADGGEGMVDAYLELLGGRKVFLTVQGLQGRPVACHYGILPDGSRREIAVLEDNWNRIWRALPQDGITVTGLTLEIRGTYGARRAEVFEICVY